MLVVMPLEWRMIDGTPLALRSKPLCVSPDCTSRRLNCHHISKPRKSERERARSAHFRTIFDPEASKEILENGLVFSTFSVAPLERNAMQTNILLSFNLIGTATRLLPSAFRPSHPPPNPCKTLHFAQCGATNFPIRNSFRHHIPNYVVPFSGICAVRIVHFPCNDCLAGSNI